MMRRRHALAMVLVASLSLSSFSSYSPIHSSVNADSEIPSVTVDEPRDITSDDKVEDPASDEEKSILDLDPQAKEVAINETNFPDQHFRSYVTKFDTDGNGKFSEKEIENINTISFFDSEILDAKGIEYFTALKQLSFSDCQYFSELDISKNTELTRLYCDFDRNLSSLDISKNTKLVEASFQCSSLKSLDVSKNTDLEVLYCNYNALTSLDVSMLTKLRVLVCSGNKFSSLDVSKNANLQSLNCNDCGLTSLNVTKNANLMSIDYGRNNLKSVDTSKNTKLSELRCTDLALTSLDLSKNPSLTSVDCSNNKLTSLNLSKNTNLMILACGNNNLSSLNVTALSKLDRLNCSDNPITSLDLSKNTDLGSLYCRNCKLTSLNVSKCRLYILDCSRNQLSALDLSTCENLCTLETHTNKIKKLDVSNCPSIVDAMEYGKLVSKDTYLAYVDPEKGDILFSFDRDTELVPPIKTPTPTAQATPTPTKVPTTTPLPTPSPVPGNKGFEGFVERLYKIALNREPEAEGKAFWVKHVVEDGATGAECARFFLLDAPEFMNRKLNDDQFVETLYSVFFDRQSEQGGKDFWLGQLKSGTPKSDVVNGFIESTEWCNVCASYGVKSGAQYHKATTPSANALAFATRLYTECLKRQPEKGGLNYWALALTNLEKNAAEAADLFFSSDEFVGFKTSDTEYVARLYRTFMGRDADEGGLDYWVSALSQGTTRYEALKWFSESPEFTALCKQYGIDRGTLPTKPGKIEINLFSMSSELYDQVMSYYNTHPDFAAKYKITSSYTNNDNQNYEKTLNSLLKSGGPDIYCAEADYRYAYINGDYSQYAAPYDQLFSDYASRAQKAAIAPYIVSLGTRNSDGKVLGLSYQSNAGVFIYRRSIAKEVFGSDSPDTIEKAIGANTNSWNTYLAAAEKLKAKGYAMASSLSDLWIGSNKAAKTPWVVNGKLNIDPVREQFLDTSKKMIDSNYCTDSFQWSADWTGDIMGTGERKVFGFFGPAWLVSYVIGGYCTSAETGYGDWAVCEAPFHFYWGGSWIMVNRNVLGTEKAAGVAELINYITLDCSKDGLQYKWATGQIYNSEHKDTIASMTVMNMLTSSDKYSWGLLNNQNPASIFTKALSRTSAGSFSTYDTILDSYFQDMARDYSHGRASRNKAIEKFKEYAAENGIDVS